MKKIKIWIIALIIAIVLILVGGIVCVVLQKKNLASVNDLKDRMLECTVVNDYSNERIPGMGYSNEINAKYYFKGSSEKPYRAEIIISVTYLNENEAQEAYGIISADNKYINVKKNDLLIEYSYIEDLEDTALTYDGIKEMYITKGGTIIEK